jgi:dihydropteroate synthase
MTIRCNGYLLDLSRPVVMGILNATPDSFFAGSRVQAADACVQQAAKMLDEGAVILDIGGASSRPGAQVIDEAEELRRVIPAIEGVMREFPKAILSVDTWRSSVAEAALDAGAAMVNDISAGRMDAQLYPLISKRNCPYILMHMQGQPENMQQDPHYENVVTEVLDFFIRELVRLRALGVRDIVLDPGFGFGKSVAHNYALLQHLHVFSSVLGLPVLVGLSRKSMICKPLRISPEAALNGTTALHVVALQQGAKILRAHDVREAREVILLHEQLTAATRP